MTPKRGESREQIVANALADWWDENQPGCYGGERPDGDDRSMAQAIVAALAALDWARGRQDEEAVVLIEEWLAQRPDGGHYTPTELRAQASNLWSLLAPCGGAAGPS